MKVVKMRQQEKLKHHMSRPLHLGRAWHTPALTTHPKGPAVPRMVITECPQQERVFPVMLFLCEHLHTHRGTK